jgi:hypothetical protein
VRDRSLILYPMVRGKRLLVWAVVEYYKFLRIRIVVRIEISNNDGSDLEPSFGKMCYLVQSAL